MACSSWTRLARSATRDAAKLFNVLDRINARAVLVGDVKQHAAVTINGRNLQRLHDYLDSHRATKVRESDLHRAKFEADAAEVVERIVIAKGEG